MSSNMIQQLNYHELSFKSCLRGFPTGLFQSGALAQVNQGGLGLLSDMILLPSLDSILGRSNARWPPSSLAVESSLHAHPHRPLGEPKLGHQTFAFFDCIKAIFSPAIAF
jgi:hypothetical protein